MVITKASEVKKFKKGMCFRSIYSWEGEPTRTYYHKVTKPMYKGKGAYTKIVKVLENGKNKPHDRSIGHKSFIWDFETQTRKIKTLFVLSKC